MKTGTFQPCHPGEILKREIEAAGVTTQQAADAIGIARKNLSFILNGHYAVSSEMAVRLSKAFGQTPYFWLNLQVAYDLSRVDEKGIKVKRLK